jgi:tRNA threonylcarbamoyladenosine modification (KEOPS) complex  Pcc1 subunit
MEAELRVAMANPQEAEVVKKAMSVDEKPGSRSSVSMVSEGKSLIMHIKASDLGALRASLNSSLRELKVADSVL